MGTRALIAIEGSDVVIYQHWDGNPEHTLPLLKSFVADFTAKRAFDAEYLTAYLIYRLKDIQDASDETAGFGVMANTCASDNSDIEFTYVIYDTGHIEVLDGNGFNARGGVL